MRFLAAPWIGLLRDDVWLRNASRANRGAESLSQKLLALPGLEVIFPCQANAIFLRMPGSLVQKLETMGWHFYRFIEPDVYRLMCSWSVTEEKINDFVTDMAKLLGV